MGIGMSSMGLDPRQKKPVTLDAETGRYRGENVHSAFHAPAARHPAKLGPACSFLGFTGCSLESRAARPRACEAGPEEAFLPRPQVHDSATTHP